MQRVACTHTILAEFFFAKKQHSAEKQIKLSFTLTTAGHIQDASRARGMKRAAKTVPVSVAACALQDHLLRQVRLHSLERRAVPSIATSCLTRAASCGCPTWRPPTASRRATCPLQMPQCAAQALRTPCRRSLSLQSLTQSKI